MISSFNLFLATLYCLAFAIVQNLGELVLLKHPIDTNSQMQSYTCMSENDGTALIWSSFSQATQIEDFEPKRPASGNVRDCAVRGESTCLAKWDETDNWRLINSVEKPTGPVFDQRFEDFQEYRSLPLSDTWRFQKVGLVNKSSSTVWFSTVGIGTFEWYSPSSGVLLCEKEEINLGPCSLILTHLRQTQIHTYNYGPDIYNGREKGTTWKSSKALLTPWLNEPNVDEWETFRLEWNIRKTTLKMFRGNNSKPFVQSVMPAWDKVSALGAYTQSAYNRLRFHFYDYYFADTKNAVISTKRIAHSGRMFCAELLVGLSHHECKLKVTLADEDGGGIETWSFSGEETNPYNGLLAWRSVRLNKRFDSDVPRLLTLKVETILDGYDSAGEWAIDNFRMCQPGNKELRESTTTLASGSSASCQKLSYAKSSVARNSDHTWNETEVYLELQEFLDPWNGSLVGKGGLICAPSGCICDEGFGGSKCEDECTDGSYGFSCIKTCGSCRNSEPCNKSTGFCENGCRGDLIAPMCKIAPPSTVENLAPSDGKTYLAWFAVPPVLAVCLLALLIWYRKRGAVFEQPRQRSRDDPLLFPDNSTGLSASEVPNPQPNRVHNQLTVSYSKAYEHK